MENVITCRNLQKTYPLYSSRADRLKEALSFTGRSIHRDYEALKGVSFRIGRGECAGIIGCNGAGKSTLLKILAGVIKPSGGELIRNGRVNALLELGAGFHPEYTGRENLFLQGFLMDRTRKETKERLEQILDFADIGQYIDQPVKKYSSGMFVRLAFACAQAFPSDILIVDEALSVGDAFFQKKCYQRMEELKRTSTVILVSHDLQAVSRFCDRVLLLHNGVLLYDGEVREGIAEYYKVRQRPESGSRLIRHPSGREQAEPARGLGQRKKPDPSVYRGKMEIRILEYAYAVDGILFRETIHSGSLLQIELLIESGIETRQLIVGYQVRDVYGNEIFGETSRTSGFETPDLKKGQSRINYQIHWPEVREGHYFITLGVGTGKTVLDQEEQCWINGSIHLYNDSGKKLIYGIFNRKLEGFTVIKERTVTEEEKYEKLDIP